MRIPTPLVALILAYLFDLTATVGDLAGVPPPAGNEGQSLVPVVRGEEATGRERLLLAYRDVQRALVTPEWKLIDYPKSGRRQLFHLATDRDELKDLAGDPAFADRRRSMEQALKTAEQEAGDPLASGPAAP
ncbi:MAG: sulfatase/phosphatase domain-containing protein [Pirellulales bacterium]